jgi:ubiquinone/menaquinone biosynthesis C-methylase UbiE
MALDDNELTVSERFDRQYLLAEHRTMLDIERSVCGCDYGGNSWATRAEVEEMGQLMKLAPGKQYLELGAGSGWPSLFLVESTGCHATLTDVSNEGLRIAEQRSRQDGINDRCRFIPIAGDKLRLTTEEFDAIGHSDVLCCLESKLATLTECRRVVRPDGVMVFSVIFITTNISLNDYQRAVDAGPLFVESPATYPELLKQSGWKLEDEKDLTEEFINSVSRLISTQDQYSVELEELMGTSDFDEFVNKNHAKIESLQAGLLQRALFVVSPE